MLIDKIEITAYYSERPSTIIIYQPSGGGEGYSFTIDGYYQGVMCLRKDEWIAYFNENSILNTEDLSVLVELITEHPNYRQD